MIEDSKLQNKNNNNKHKNAVEEGNNHIFKRYTEQKTKVTVLLPSIPTILVRHGAMGTQENSSLSNNRFPYLSVRSRSMIQAGSGTLRRQR